MTTTEGANLNEYRIAAFRLPTLVKDIERLNKRADKLGVPGVTLTELRRESETVKIGQNIFGEDIMQEREWAIISVEGEPVVLNGWSFVATIEHTEQGNIIRRVIGDEREIDLTAYRNTGRICEHCRQNRQRNDTYIVANEDGRTAQVGSNCLADFIGFTSRDPKAIASWLDNFYTLTAELSDGGDDDEWGFGGRSGERVIPIESFMATVAARVQECGWLSRGQAWQGDATADMVWEYYSDRKPVWKPGLSKDEYMALRDDMIKGIEWARELPEDIDNDYLYNLRVACLNDTVNRRRAGIVASLYIAYMKHLEREAKRAAKANKPQPTTNLEAGRIQVEGEVVSLKWVEGFGYNTSTLKGKLLLTDGNEIWGTIPSRFENDVEIGTKLRMTVTIQPKDEHFGFYSRPSKAEIL